MKRIVLLASLAMLAIFATGFVSADDKKCDCPDPSTHGAWKVIVDKELSTAEAIPTAGPFGFAKSMTVCMTYDQQNKGFAQNVYLNAEGSIDGRTWYPLTLPGTTTPAQTSNGCLQVSPTRFVRVGWGPLANVQAPGPRVTASVQVGY